MQEKNDPKAQASSRKNRNSASAIAKLASGSVAFAGKSIGEAVHAAARVTLANRWGVNDVYWYGDETAVLLAEEDLNILYTECDRLLGELRGYAIAPQEDEWHGQDEPDTEPGDFHDEG